MKKTTCFDFLDSRRNSYYSEKYWYFARRVQKLPKLAHGKMVLIVYYIRNPVFL